MSTAGRRLVPRRYQLKKEAAWSTKSGHPWIFRSSLSQAASIFSDGQLVQLVDPENKPLGFGIYQENGVVAVRVFRLGEHPPDTAWFRKQVTKAIKKRENLRKYTSAFRAIHGENDGLPGIVVEVYNETIVLQTYASSVDAYGRWVAAEVAAQLGLKNILWKQPAKRVAAEGDTTAKVRILRGKVGELEKFREGQMEFAADLKSGQKSGTFLDLRGLRKWVATQKLVGKRVLNLYAYTGSLGLCAEQAGAKEIWEVDVAKPALEFAKKNHVKDGTKHHWFAADIFKWLPDLEAKEVFDLVIVDPPNMAAATSQVPVALKTYKKLYTNAKKHVRPGGLIVGACCTSRIPRYEFEKLVGTALGHEFKLLKSLQPEDDHPVGFKEGDYLKILIFERWRG